MRTTKRIFDVAIALPLFIVSAPLVALCALLIRLESNGAAIFAQVRLGKRQKPFTCYKLRTMYIDTDERPSHEISRNSVTRIGGFLRASKIDELPQLWNVIIADMSIVGPRPCLPTQKEVIYEREKLDVFSILPGVTGAAQVRGVDMSDPVKLAKLDGSYAKNMSLMKDIRIIFDTFSRSAVGDKTNKVSGTE